MSSTAKTQTVLTECYTHLQASEPNIPSEDTSLKSGDPSYQSEDSSSQASETFPSNVESTDCHENVENMDSSAEIEDEETQDNASADNSDSNKAYIIEDEHLLGIKERERDNLKVYPVIRVDNTSRSKEDDPFIIEEHEMSVGAAKREEILRNLRTATSLVRNKQENDRKIDVHGCNQSIVIVNAMSDKMKNDQGYELQPLSIDSVSSQRQTIKREKVEILHSKSVSPIFPGLPGKCARSCTDPLKMNGPIESFTATLTQIVLPDSTIPSSQPNDHLNPTSNLNLKCNLNESRVEHPSDSDTDTKEDEGLHPESEGENYQVPKLNLQGLPGQTESGNSSARSDTSLDYLKNMISSSYPFFNPYYAYMAPYYSSVSNSSFILS